MRQSKLWISILIIMIVGLHAVPVLSYQRNRQTRWPILAWAMYAKSIPPGPVEMRRRRVFAITSSGRKELVTPYLAGTGQTRNSLRNMYINSMWVGDSSAAQRLFRRLNRDRKDPFVQIRLEGEKYTLVGDSVVKEDFPAVIYTVDSASPGRGMIR
ncbi:MAG TPA: hypothetical protein VJ808_04370 [Gemmatimonadales bacterium]|nr:hypothetical protein [Gemmatimonadales bacterium]